MTGAAYVGVVDCVEQMRLANAEAVRAAWQHALVVGLMAAVLCAAVWAVCHVVRRKVRSPATRAVLAFLALGMTAYGGTKVVTELGIRLTKCKVDAKKVVVEWETADERIRPGSTFLVQALRGGSGGWETVATTTASNTVIPRFTVDRTHTWRVAVDLGEVQGDEDDEGGEE